MITYLSLLKVFNKSENQTVIDNDKAARLCHLGVIGCEWDRYSITMWRMVDRCDLKTNIQRRAFAISYQLCVLEQISEDNKWMMFEAYKLPLLSYNVC